MLTCMETLGKRKKLDAQRKLYDADTFKTLLDMYASSSLYAVSCDGDTNVIEVAGGDVAQKTFVDGNKGKVLGKVIAINVPMLKEGVIDTFPYDEKAKLYDGVAFFVGVGMLSIISDGRYLVNEDKLKECMDMYCSVFEDEDKTISEETKAYQIGARAHK